VFREAWRCSTTTARDRAGPGCPSQHRPAFGFTSSCWKAGRDPAPAGRIQQEIGGFDQILEAVEKEHLGGLSAVRVVNLDLGGDKSGAGAWPRRDAAVDKPASSDKN